MFDVHWMLNIYLDFRKVFKYSSTTINNHFPVIYDIVFMNRPKSFVSKAINLHELRHWNPVCPIWRHLVVRMCFA